MGNSNSNPKLMTGVPRVLVIGGGYAGTTVARLLDATGRFAVVLFDRKNYFLHNVASLRASVDESVAWQALIPYGGLLKNGAVIQAEVREVSRNAVVLDGHNEPIGFDYLVIALGSSYAFPGKVSEPSRARALSLYSEINHAISRAKRVVVIGGGPVGVELAGELITEFGASQGMEVSLIHSHEQLLHESYGLRSEFRDRAASILKDKGVRLLLGERVLLNDEQRAVSASSDRYYLQGPTRLQTDRGTELEADLVLFATGTRVNNRALRSHFASALNADGRLRVNSLLQVEGSANVFAIGDIAAVESKMAFMAGRQAEALSGIIDALAQGKTPKPYEKLAFPAMGLSIGRDSGVFQLFNKSGTILGPFITSAMKSKQLFVPPTWKKLGAERNEARYGPVGTQTAQELQQLLYTHDQQQQQQQQQPASSHVKSAKGDDEKSRAAAVSAVPMQKDAADALAVRSKNVSYALHVQEQTAKALIVNGAAVQRAAPGTDTM